MKIWIHFAALTLLATVLAGCSRDDQPGSEPVQPVADAGTDAANKPLKKPLAKNMALSFTYHLRRDRVEEVKPDVFRRRVMIEYLGLSQQQAANALISDMAAAGYMVNSERLEDDGRTRLSFQKGKRKITAVVRHGGKLQNPGATGAILISIPAKAPKSKKDADKPVTDEPATDEQASS